MHTSIAGEVVDKQELIAEMAGKWSIKPYLADKLANILIFLADKETVTTEAITSKFGFSATSAKRYLRKLADLGYIEARGGNRNRSYNSVTGKWTGTVLSAHNKWK
ncbi:MAG: hypothetical protein MJZ32_00220 [Bacteroidaceae bacterium]|nr:hypothetical protein [Bacteroidaceae bacterium]